jgi:hypothetical protein
MRFKETTHVLDFGVGGDVFGIVGEIFEDDLKIFQLNL